MKRFAIIIILMISALPAVFPAEQDTEYSTLDTKGLRLDGNLGPAGSIHSAFLSVNPEILYDFGIISLGAGVNTLFGMTFSDIYIAPYAQTEIAWFYLSGGAIFELKPPAPNTEKAPDGFISSEEDNSCLPYIVLGTDFIIIPIGPGGLGIDLYTGFIPTATPVQVVDTSEDFLANLIGSIFTSLISAAFDSVKLGASLYYSYTF